ncbi:MAG: sugar ABC transporter permease [Candidatus Atribacteria bacterium]|jgi:ABC-type maltose transport system permease subunit|nr:MAG: sugar ABC transporter permease [Candidatus Atribacteria bacterium]
MYDRHTLGGSIWRHALILLLCAFSIFPVLWIASASFNATNNMGLQTLIPRHPTFAHYKELFTSDRYQFSMWLLNSLKITIIAATLTVMLAALGAYAFSRFRFKGRRAGLLGLLLIQMFPQVGAIVAIFLLVLSLGNIFPWAGLNTHTALIFVYLGGAMGFNTWLMKGYFDTIPRSLEESAKVDGATPFQAFFWIILPLARPILATIFVLSFISAYSELIIAQILLRSGTKFTLPVGMALLVSDQWSQRWGMFAAGALIAMIPFLIVFILAQRSLVSGLTRGSVKE